MANLCGDSCCFKRLSWLRSPTQQQEDEIPDDDDNYERWHQGCFSHHQRRDTAFHRHVCQHDTYRVSHIVVSFQNWMFWLYSDGSANDYIISKLISLSLLQKYTFPSWQLHSLKPTCNCCNFQFGDTVRCFVKKYVPAKTAAAWQLVQRGIFPPSFNEIIASCKICVGWSLLHSSFNSNQTSTPLLLFMALLKKWVSGLAKKLVSA